MASMSSQGLGGLAVQEIAALVATLVVEESMGREGVQQPSNVIWT